MSEPTGRPDRVERVATEAELAALQGPWKTLLDAMPHASVFLTWEWVSVWWRNREPGWELWLLTARDETGELAGLAPWMLQQERIGPLPLRRLSFVHNSGMLPNRMDIIARPVDQGAVCSALLGYLAGKRGEWDILDLEALAETSQIRGRLAGGRGLYLEREPFACPYATLPAAWEAYERERLTANRRQQIRSRARRLERDYPGQVEYHRVETADELPEALGALVALNEARWHKKGLHASFDDECFVAFQREFAPLALQQGWLRFYLLRVGGKPIAAEYCFRHRDALVNYQRGFDVTWERYSPGLLLYAHAIREAIEEGAGEFDMLRGEHEYKLSWADRRRFDLHPLLSNSLSGHASLLGGVAFDAAQSLGRRALPAPVRQRINRFLGGRRT